MAQPSWRVAFFCPLSSRTKARLMPTGDRGPTASRAFLSTPPIRPGAEWYNPAAFQIPQFPGQSVQCCRFGDAARGSIVGPGEFMTQWAFWKEFRFNTPLNHEDTLFQFRWENYNFFNHPVLGNPNMVIDSSQAGEITTLGGLGGGEGYVPHAPHAIHLAAPILS